MSLVHERKPTILLVEDSRDEELLVIRAVRQTSLVCQVVVVHTTDEALDFLFRQGVFSGRDLTNPDVVVSDLKVHSIGGEGLVSEIRAHSETRLIPIVVLTSAASEKQIRDLYLRGANSFLEKPTDFEEFSALIRQLASYWGGLNRTATYPDRPTSFPYPL
jgi:two-component system, response regulator